MTVPVHWDVVVIGAGPAGAAAAFHLAKLGRRVALFDRRAFPRDKCCGDGLTPYTLRLIEEMGCLGAISAYPQIDSVRIVHIEKDWRTRDFPYSDLATEHKYGLVVPRAVLDHELVKAAVGAGAELFTGQRVLTATQTGSGQMKVQYCDSAGVTHDLTANAVVAADGASSRFAQQVRGDHTGAELGSAVRGYFRDIADMGTSQEIYLPLTDESGEHLLPSYGWVFPLGDGRANVGVGLFKKVPVDNVRNLYDRFVALMIERDPRFKAARADGTAKGAPLRFDFDPGACAGQGILLVGDAAGLTSPFSGEGISYAMDSGKIAAETIHRSLLHSPSHPTFEDDYATLMEHRFAGYFETGQQAAPRHQLLWRVLDNTFDSERPIFALLRRLVLVPEAAGGSGHGELLEDVGHLFPRGDALLQQQLYQVGSKLVATLRRDWPFFSRLEQARAQSRLFGLRPSTLALLSARSGDPVKPELIELAVALDIAYAGQIAQSGVMEEAEIEVGKSNWGNKFAILLSDYLLSSALESFADHNAINIRDFVAAIESHCDALMVESAQAWSLDVDVKAAVGLIERQAEPFFALPCRIGAMAAGADTATIAALEGYGRALSIAVMLTQQCRAALTDRPGSLLDVAGSVRNGVLTVPLLLAAEDAQARAILVRQCQEKRICLSELRGCAGLHAGIVETRALVAQETARAINFTSKLPPNPAFRTLAKLAEHIRDTG